MSSPSALFQAGVQAVKQGRYSEAVQILETFCRSNANSRSKDYFQAQMWLIKAYQKNVQSKQAIALCRQLAASENPQVQAWARRILPSLFAPKKINSQVAESSPSPDTQSSQALFEEQSQSAQPTIPTAPSQQSLTPQEAAERLRTGNKALKQGHYAEAVQALEEFCRGTDSSTQHYSQAQMRLVKAYKGNGQIEEAIALCKQLTTNANQVAQIWAEQFLLSLSPTETCNTPSSTPESILPVEEAANVPSSHPHPSAAGPDLTGPILSVVCHGSIFFSASLIAIFIPLAIWLLYKDPIVVENAKEAFWFHINLIVSLIFCLVVSIIIPWIGLPLLVLTLISSFVMPILAIIQCIQNPQKPFHYLFISKLF